MQRSTCCFILIYIILYIINSLTMIFLATKYKIAYVNWGSSWVLTYTHENHNACIWMETCEKQVFNMFCKCVHCVNLWHFVWYWNISINDYIIKQVTRLPQFVDRSFFLWYLVNSEDTVYVPFHIGQSLFPGIKMYH
jgi:hypothetical protein